MNEYFQKRDAANVFRNPPTLFRSRFVKNRVKLRFSRNNLFFLDFRKNCQKFQIYSKLCDFAFYFFFKKLSILLIFLNLRIFFEFFVILRDTPFFQLCLEMFQTLLLNTEKVILFYFYILL